MLRGRKKVEQLYEPVALADVEAIADVDALRGAVSSTKIGRLVVVVTDALAAEVKVLMESVGEVACPACRQKDEGVPQPR